MGTRGAIGWKLNGKYTCVYNHFDSYPEYLGIKMLILCGDITSNDSWDVFKEKISNITVISADDVPSKKVLNKYTQYRDTTVNGDDGENPTWYSVLRDIQGVQYFVEVLMGNLEHLPDDTYFMYDSVFCEYAYTFNLDTMEMEFWAGFQKKPCKTNPLGTKKTNGYYPVKIVHSIPFKDVGIMVIKYLLTITEQDILNSRNIPAIKPDTELSKFMTKLNKIYEKDSKR